MSSPASTAARSQEYPAERPEEHPDDHAQENSGGPASGRRRRPPVVAIAAVTVVALSVLSLGVGVAGVGPLDVFSPDAAQWEILRISRIPRLVALLLAGAAMAVAGLIMQRITGNRFVSPSTSGTVEAAVLGVIACAVLVPSAGLLPQIGFAIGAAVLGTIGFLCLLQTLRRADTLTVALVGMMYGGVLGAIGAYLAYQADLMQMLELWTTGAGSSLREGTYEPLYLVLAVGAIGYLFADRFTVVGMGEDVATNLGVKYRSVLYVGLVVVSMMAALVVVVVGAIPFLGLIVPNIVSMMLGDNVRRVLPITALAGAGFVVACDLLGRLVRYPYEVPFATIAGIIGAAVFIVLILRAARGDLR